MPRPRLFPIGRPVAGWLLTIAALLPAAAPAAPVSTFTLDNGLEVVVIEDHRAPVAVQMLWYRIGAADEPAGKSGIAHFLEHLMFKGTGKVPPGAFSTRIEAVGGNDNAFTGWDYTAYYQRVAADRLPMVMEMEADRMRNLRLLPEDVATERQVILEERGQRTDSSPGALLMEQMRAALFQNSHYGIPVIGWRHEMAGLTREDALDWYRRHYAPDNAILVIAGDVTPGKVRALAGEYYGPIAPAGASAPRLRPQEPPQLAERRITLSDPRVSNPSLMRLYLAPARRPGDQGEAAALSILAALLGGDGQTSVLARALQFDRKLAVQTAAYYDGTAINDTTFAISILPAAGVTLAEAEAGLDAALDRFVKEGPDPAAFERIKMQIRADAIYARDDAEGLARMYGEELTVGLSLADVQDYDRVLAGVTLDEVKAAAARVLDRRAAVTGWLTPPGGDVPAATGDAVPAPDMATDTEMAQ